MSKPSRGPMKSETSIPASAPIAAISRSSDSASSIAPRALRDAVDDDALPARRCARPPQHARALDARDLDAEVGAVGEARALAGTVAAPRAARRSKHGVGSSCRGSRLRCRGSRCAERPRRPRPAARRPCPSASAAPPSLDQVRVLGLAAAARRSDSRRSRGPSRSRCRYQRLSRWLGHDLELALAVARSARPGSARAMRRDARPRRTRRRTRSARRRRSRPRDWRRACASRPRARRCQAARTAVGQTAAAGEARRGGVQAAAFGDDDCHDEPRAPARRTRAGAGTARRARRRRRSGRPRTRPRARARSAMRAWTSRSRSPGRQSRSARSSARGGVDGERREALAARPAGARGAGPRARRRRRCRSRVAVARELRAGCAGELARGRDEARRRRRTTRSSRAAGRGGQVVLGLDARALDVGGQRDRVARCDDDPHRARRRARLDAIRQPGGQPGDGARRGQHDHRERRLGEQRAHGASFAATSAGAELSAVPNGELMIANASRSIGLVNPGFVRQSRTVFAMLERYCDDAG